MKKVTTPTKHTSYVNHLGQTINVQHEIESQQIIKRYNQQKKHLSQFEPNKRIRK